jgi:hypothetical protein
MKDGRTIHADLGHEREVGDSDARASEYQDIALLTLGATRDNILSGEHAALDGHAVALARGEFDHDDGISAFGQGRSCHNLNTLTWANDVTEVLTGFDLAGAGQETLAGRQIRAAHGITITNGAMKGRIVTIGDNRDSQHAVETPAKRDRFDRGTQCCGGDGLHDTGAGFLKTWHYESNFSSREP